MKKLHRLWIILLGLAVVFAMLPLPAQAAKKTKFDIKKEALHWGIRSGRSFTTPLYYRGLSEPKYVSWTVSRPVISDIPKKDSRKMVFTVSMTNMNDFSQSQVDAILAANEEGGWLKCLVLDQKTGLLLHKKNKRKVKVATRVLETARIDSYYSSDKSNLFYPVRRYRARITVTFPDTFNVNRLCLGIGTYKEVLPISSADRRFLDGKLRIDKSKLFRQYNDSFRFANLRVMSGEDDWF
ncbi:MAG: hypothetical protein IJV04_05745 [Lachnospiraceae bacterium]|nr:hypothetical protein [Lachnospiraceae bacterium]